MSRMLREGRRGCWGGMGEASYFSGPRYRGVSGVLRKSGLGSCNGWLRSLIDGRTRVAADEMVVWLAVGGRRDCCTLDPFRKSL